MAGAALTACGGGKSADEAASGTSNSKSTFTGKYTGPAVTLAYWNGFTGGDGPSMDKLVEEFQQANLKIKIKQNTIQWADFYQKVPAAVTAGKGPDVGVMHQDQLATNAARKVILPVDDVAKALDLKESDFSPEVWQAGIYQGKRYGIPLDVHSLGMYLRSDDAKKAGVASPPTDKASFDQALQAFKDKGGMAQPFWMPSKWPAHLMFLSLLWQNGGEPYADDGSKATYDSDAGVAALTWMVDQIKKGYSPKNVAIDTQYVGFKNNKLAVTWDGIWQINDLKGAKTPFELAPIPKIGDQEAVWANSHNFFVTRQSTAGRQQVRGGQGLHRLDEQEVRRVGRLRPGARPGPRCARTAQVTSSAQGPDREEDRHDAVPAARAGSRRRPGPDAGDRSQRGDPAEELAGGRTEQGGDRGQQRDAGQPEEVRGLTMAAATTEAALRVEEGERLRSTPGGRGQSGSRATPWLFLAPYLVLFVAFVVAPAVYGFWISLHDYDYTLPGKPWVGLDNYRALFDSSSLAFDRFWNSMRATAIFTVLSVPLLLVVPLGVGAGDEPEVPRAEPLPGHLLRAVRAGCRGGRGDLWPSCSTTTSAWSTTTSGVGHIPNDIPWLTSVP